MTRNPIMVFSGVAFGVFAIGLIVLSAIESGSLLTLVAGIVAVCIIGAVLTAFAMRMYERWTEARIKAIKLQNSFTLAMAKEGFIRSGIGYEPVKQIDAPAQKRSTVFDFNPNDIHTAAVNYILFSRNLLGDSGNRLASAPECASAGIENYSARSWERIVTHLSNCYGVVRQPGPIANGGGVYVPDEIGNARIGTVGNLYHHIVLNSAVESLPEAKR